MTQVSKEEGAGMFRDDLVVNWVRGLDVERHWSWLDVGAGRGQVSRALIAPLLPKHSYRCFDTQPRHPTVEVFDGKELPDTGRVDFVLFNFVLHHAGSDMRALLRSAMSKTNTLLVQEDLRDGTVETDTKLWKHDPNGVFLSSEQWVKVFREVWPAASVLVQPHPMQAVNIQEIGYDVPRCLFLVNESNSK